MQHPIWLHGASVGDVRALAPLAHALEEAQNSPLLLTAVTKGGLETAQKLVKNSLKNAEVSKFPIPIWPFPDRFLKRHQPRALILEYCEIWPAIVRACFKQQIPVLLVDGHITNSSLRIRTILKTSAKRLSLCLVQREQDRENAQLLGISPEIIHVTGNGKYDGAIKTPAPSEELRSAIGPRDLILGSVHKLEIPEIIELLANNAHNNARVLIALREPTNAAALCQALKAKNLDAALRSEGAAHAQIAVLDTFGELAASYALAPVVIMGGSFCKREGQNIIEAAAQGCAVIHGPRTANIQLEVEALDGFGAIQVDSLAQAFECAASKNFRIPSCDVLLSLCGATRRAMPYILDCLRKSPF